MRPYFPILKAKRGEYTTLVELDPITRSRIVPIIELLPAPKARTKPGEPERPPTSVDQQVTDHVRCLAQSSSTCYPVLVDFSRLPETPTSDGRHPAAAIMSALRNREVMASPVIRPNSSLSLLVALRDSGCTGDGLGLRIEPADFDAAPERVEVVLSFLSAMPERVDAIVDFGSIEDASALRRGMIRAALADTARRPWRSLSLGAASFPASLTALEEGLHRFRRYDWTTWLELDETAIGREIGYADYGMRAVAPPVSGGSAPTPNLRYTVEEEWLVLKAKQGSKNEWYEGLAFDLTHLSEWMGSSHCAGCRRFERCADGDKGKTAEQAISAAMTHHVTYVAQQLANLDAGAVVS